LLLGGLNFLLAIAILLTFSRGAYLGSLTVIGFMLYVQRKFFMFLLALLLFPIAALLMPQAVTERATHGMQGNDIDAITSGRVVEIWQPLLPEITKSPLLGSGIGSILWSDAAKQQTILPVGHPHSAYLGMLLDFGLLGTAVIILFFKHMWHLFTELGKHAQDPLWRGFFTGAAACILLLLVQGTTDDSFMPTRTQPFLWLAYGMAIGFISKQKAMESFPKLSGSNATERFF
jgi:O-antigen ligase